MALGRVLPVRFKTPEGLTHLDGEPTAAEGLIGYTHVRGIRVTTKGPCRVAGKSGTTYYSATPLAAAPLLLETVTACVAKGSGPCSRTPLASRLGRRRARCRYLQLNEPSASVLRGYASTLEAKGFAVTSSSDSAAADIEQLTKGDAPGAGQAGVSSR